MLTEKEKKFYETIYKFINDNGYSPTIRELCKLLNYKSTKTIYNYLKVLKNKNYINYQKKKKRSIVINKEINKRANVFNNKFTNLNLNESNILFQIKNNYYNNYFIKKDDYLIINTKKKIKNNDLGLFLINSKYRIMKYNYYDGYYILEDNTKEILYKINLICVVEKIYRENI